MMQSVIFWSLLFRAVSFLYKQIRNMVWHTSQNRQQAYANRADPEVLAEKDRHLAGANCRSQWPLFERN